VIGATHVCGVSADLVSSFDIQPEGIRETYQGTPTVPLEKLLPKQVTDRKSSYMPRENEPYGHW